MVRTKKPERRVTGSFLGKVVASWVSGNVKAGDMMPFVGRYEGDGEKRAGGSSSSQIPCLTKARVTGRVPDEVVTWKSGVITAQVPNQGVLICCKFP